MEPYKEVLEDNISYRTFPSTTKQEELVWHRDREDRLVKAIGKTDWKVQFDNDIPIVLKEVFIPKGVYHRILKGSSDLKIKVVKNYKPTL